MKIEISETFDVRQYMAIEAVVRLAADINGKTFASNLIQADALTVNSFVLAVIIAAMQICDNNEFEIFRAYYGIGVAEVSTTKIALQYNITEYIIAETINNIVSDIHQACQ